MAANLKIVRRFYRIGLPISFERYYFSTYSRLQHFATPGWDGVGWGHNELRKVDKPSKPNGETQKHKRRCGPLWQPPLRRWQPPGPAGLCRSSPYTCRLRLTAVRATNCTCRCQRNGGANATSQHSELTQRANATRQYTANRRIEPTVRTRERTRESEPEQRANTVSQHRLSERANRESEPTVQAK